MARKKKRTISKENLSPEEILARKEARTKLVTISSDIKTGISSGLYQDVEKAIMESYSSQIDKYVKATYGGKDSTIKTTRMFEAISDIQTTLKRDEDLRKEKIMERNIAQASLNNGVSKYSKEEVKIFYGATQKLWEGKPIEERNKVIKEKLGVETLEEAWEKVFANESVKQALDEAKRNQKPIGSDVDMQDGSNDEKEGKGSPPYMKGLVLDLDTNG